MRKIVFRSFFLLLLLPIVSLSSLSAQEGRASRALEEYVAMVDDSYSWQVVDSLRQEGVTAYRLHLTSQVWQQYKWIHELVIAVPDKLSHREALLHISGGSVDPKTELPRHHGWEDSTISFLSSIAKRCEAITAVVWQVPRQPIEGMYEDELVSYTFHKFQKTKDYTLPLLFPMVKSVVRAMDAIEEFTADPSRAKLSANRFLLNGISKRGWTTWLTAASGDKRIVAIAPMVIDIVNMPVNVPYQKYMFGSYSIMIQDYVNLGLTEELATPEGWELVEMIDPYSYRKLYTMPKMIFFGTNDEYWTVDAVKNYIEDIPDTKFISYVTNAGHGLGDKKAAMNSLEAFFYQTIIGKAKRGAYPRFDYKIESDNEGITLKIKGQSNLIEEIILWEATSKNKDFRKEKFIPTTISHSGKKSQRIAISYPQSGYKAFMVMLRMKHPIGGEPYNITTRMYSASSSELFDKPYSTEPQK